jgi:hypothetical protein
MATIIHLSIHPSIVSGDDQKLLDLIKDSKEIVNRCSNTNIVEPIITWAHLFAVSQLCKSRNVKMYISYTKDGKRHEHAGYSLDEYLLSQLFSLDKEPQEDKLLTKAKDLFGRLGGIGNEDARIVSALIQRIESMP